MKNETFREQFDKVAKELTAQRRHKMLCRALEILRDAVQEMQDNGYPVTLELRLRDEGLCRVMTVDERKQVSANGSIRFGEGGPALEFVCQQQYAEAIYFKASIGTHDVLSLYGYGEDVALMKQGIRQCLMSVQAEHEMVAKFALGDRSGKAAMIGKTVLPKPPKS